MNVKPILFSTPMVFGIITKQKTQTRRLLKPQPETMLGPAHIEHNPGTCTFDLHFGARFNGTRFVGSRRMQIVSTPYAPGDLLWVRETWGVGTRPCPSEGWVDGIEYRADEIDDDCAPLYSVTPPDGVEMPEPGGGWKPSIFMPRWISRLTLKVTEVRIERLNSITEEDALAEGVVFHEKRGFIVPGVNHPNKVFPYLARSTAREMYAALWDTINGSGAWGQNPWVVAYTFTAHGVNVDEYLRRQERNASR
jgi:hypothetical protein